MHIREELEKNEVLLSAFSKDHYNELLLEALGDLKGKKVCYVTLNKSAFQFIKGLNANKIPADEIFFIDAVSMGLGKEEHRDNVLLVSSPIAFTELNVAITEALRSGYFDVLIFDSLSTFNIYKIDDHIIERFSSDLINKIKAENKKAIFTCLAEDSDSGFIKNLYMYVDKVIKPTELTHTTAMKKHGSTAAAVTTVVLLVAITFLGSDISGSLSGDITGNFVLVSTGGIVEQNPFILSLFVFLALLAVVNLYVIYRPSLIVEISKSKLQAIRPKKLKNSDVGSLKSKFKDKLHDWLKKAKKK